MNPLETTPGVPEGWTDISNDDALLGKFGLNKSMLFDDDTSPIFWRASINRSRKCLVQI